MLIMLSNCNLSKLTRFGTLRRSFIANVEAKDKERQRERYDQKLFTIIIMASIIAVGFVCKDSWLDVIRDGGVYSVLFSMLLVAACVFSRSSRLRSLPD
ncbi:hypothetical protein PO124_14955 [Bacillus licheniformis]|nr:hypothetical protein [Bacillus licheniformis]